MGLFDYDDSSIDSILKYTAENLIGRTLHNILEEFQNSEYKTYEDKKKGTPSTTARKEISKLSKGLYGNIIEECFYGFKPNNSPEPDIPEACLEIKTTPYRVNTDGVISAKERLVLSMFNFHEENLEDFYLTHLWNKCQNILLLFYKYQKTRDIFKNITDKAFLFDWPEEDMPIILEDYKRITQKILEGRAHELSESDGMYLSTCRKGAGKDKNRTTQPYGPELANRRAWSLKSSYMTTLLRSKVFTQEEQESIAKAARDTSKPFTQIIEEELLKYRGKSEKELCKEFDVKFKSKGRNSTLVRKILGLSSDIDNTVEFKKANMNIRAIRVNKNGLPEEDSPFKNYIFNELLNEKDWEESHIYTEIFSKELMFVVFRETAPKTYVLDHVKFWGFPESFEPELMRVWQETKDIIIQGIKLTPKPFGEDGVRVFTNFPKSQKNKIIFTKVHASESYYELEPGKFVGKGSLKDTDELPDGRRITKHSFWLPKKFVQQILRGEWD